MGLCAGLAAHMAKTRVHLRRFTPLQHPKYHLTETIIPLIDVRWRVLVDSSVRHVRAGVKDTTLVAHGFFSAVP